ncbi:MAG: Ku protein [Myxococcales bacterium]|nr:Ku protein [Myxococcales bacterium]
MAARAIASGTISFGLVSIPVKLYTAASSEQARFNLLHKKCGGRMKQQYFCPTDNEVVERDDIVKGYEYARNQFVQVTEDELKQLEAARTGSLDIVEFVPLASVDFVEVEKSYYLGPDKGGDKAYQLLGEAMRRRGVVAVGRYAARGKEQLVLVRPYTAGDPPRHGLVLHQLYYANELRAFADVETGASFQFSQIEQDLADRLIDQLSVPRFDAGKYADSYDARVHELIDKKVAGQEISIAPEQPRAQIIDLFEALKLSLSRAQGGAGANDATAAAAAPGAAPAPAPSGAPEAALDEEAPVTPKPVKKATPRKAAKAPKAETG